MNKKKIEELIDLMNKHNLSEINIDEENFKVHLKKGMGELPAAIPQVISPGMIVQEKSKAEDAGKKPAANLIEIKSPIVGTFYKAAAPDAPSFVEVGSQIKEGDVICIIEAMKLMNELKAEVNGKISKILVENAEPIEYGQVLFLVEPA